MHGCRRVFHNEKEPAFKAIYNLINQVILFFRKLFFVRLLRFLNVKRFIKYDFKEKSRKALFQNLKKTFEEKTVADTYCGKSKDAFFKSIRKQLKEHRNVLK